jgi:hypothetical protein
MSLIDRDWLAKMCPGAMVLTRASGVSVRGIDNKPQETSNYVVLQVYIPTYEKDSGKNMLAEVRRLPYSTQSRVQNDNRSRHH